MQSSYDYERRKVADAAPELKTSFRFKWQPGVLGTILVVSLMVNRKLAGKLSLAEEKPGQCQKDVDALASRGLKADIFWTVHKAAILPEFTGKGLGTKLYQAALQYIVKKQGAFYVGPMSCLGYGTTSESAERVWDSLSRKYPSSGHVLYVR